MAKNSGRSRTLEMVPGLAATELRLGAAQTARLLAAEAGPTPPAVSPPGSIIPTLPAAPGNPNWTQPQIVQNTALTIAAGAYLYSDKDMYLVTGDSYYNAPLIVDGTLYFDGHLSANLYSSGLIWRAAISTDVINHGTTVVLAHDDRPRVGQSDATAFFNFHKLDNSGQVFAWAEYGVANALVSDSVAQITNSGLLAASAQSGLATTIRLSNGGGIRNLAGGQILAEAPLAKAISFYNAGIPSGYTYQVENAGLIQARSTNVNNAAIALSFTHASYQTVRVLNSGTITADIAIIDQSATEGAFSPVQASIQIITNQASGIINGDIILDRGDDQIFNSGTINGYVLLGEGNDTFDTSAGALNGPVDLYWGNDIFKGSAGADHVVGSDGNDSLEGNAGNDQLMGGGNDDTLNGGLGNDGLFGEYGNDRIATLGGDFVWGGAGDDRIELGDYTFELVDGNDGFDTLVLPTGARILDLSAMLAHDAIKGIEALILNGSKELVVRAADIPLIADSGTTLRISGAAGDKLDLVGAWSDAGTVTIGGTNWHQYQLDGKSVLVSGSVAVTNNATPPAGATGLDPFAGGDLAPVPGDAGALDFTPTDSYLVGYHLTQSTTVNAEETWWNDLLFPVLLSSANSAHITLTNYGHILSVGDAATTGSPLALDGLDLFQNYGTVTGEWHWQKPQNYTEMELGGVGGTGFGKHIVNDGIIEALADHGGAVGVSKVGILTNHTEIRGISQYGWAVGVVEVDILDNQGLIRADGAVSAVGIHFRGGDRNTNAGRIEAHVTVSSGLSIGAEFELGYPSEFYHFTNSGTITGDYSLRQVQSNYSGFGPMDVTNTGALVGIVELGKSADRITNTGTITGAVRLLDGDDIFDGSGGLQGGDVHGGLGNDQLTGGRGADRLFGDEGNDILKAGSGNDWLEGGAGADTFVFTAPGDSHEFAQRSDGHKLRPDVIADFAPGTDKIDLSAIDAITGTGANDAFNFIGSAAFSHQAGQVRFETAGGFTSIFADMDGDGFADMQIILKTPVTLTAADFVL